VQATLVEGVHAATVVLQQVHYISHITTAASQQVVIATGQTSVSIAGGKALHLRLPVSRMCAAWCSIISCIASLKATLVSD
jgi:predicted ABC-type sugar transport system permease subunit